MPLSQLSLFPLYAFFIPDIDAYSHYKVVSRYFLDGLVENIPTYRRTRRCHFFLFEYRCYWIVLGYSLGTPHLIHVLVKIELFFCQLPSCSPFHVIYRATMCEFLQETHSTCTPQHPTAVCLTSFDGV